MPAAGKPGFELADGEMEMGGGIHGEPGVRRAAMEPVDAMVDEMLEKILGDIDYSGHEVAVMVNSSGATQMCIRDRPWTVPITTTPFVVGVGTG